MNNFIDDIVGVVEAKTESTAKKPSGKNSPSKTSRGKQTTSTQEMESTAKPKSEPAMMIPRAFAKARIQKSIRFKPNLLERLEQHLEKLESEGEKVPSLQDVQNDSLELWLDKYSS